MRNDQPQKTPFFDKQQKLLLKNIIPIAVVLTYKWFFMW